MNEFFISGLMVFMLSTFVGLDVIKKVSPLLHTPLMSLTNAISAISIAAELRRRITEVTISSNAHGPRGRQCRGR